MEYSQKKNRNVIFFKKFCQNQRSFFSRKFLQEISNFSKITQYFQFIVFGPLRRVFKTSFGKFLEKKSEYFFFKKFRTTFFFCEKIGFLGLFSKMPPLGRRFDPGWPQDFSPPPLKNTLPPFARSVVRSRVATNFFFPYHQKCSPPSARSVVRFPVATTFFLLPRKDGIIETKFL